MLYVIPTKPRINSLDRGSRSQMFFKIGVLKNFCENFFLLKKIHLRYLTGF